MATVDLIKIVKNHGSHVILDNINLNIEKGEFVALVGPSGSGKTTLLRMVAGLESITKGQIKINGECVNNLAPAQRDMAMVFQNYALYPHMNVYANMAYGLKMRGISKPIIRQKVNAVSSMLQLQNLLDRKPSELSGGQKQRVAMGRAIVRSPSVFLFDEPLSNLDAKLRNEMRYEIKKLHMELSTTSLYVTHDQTEAMTLADKIVVLNKGIIEQIGTPTMLYNTPQTKFVASFIGTYPMNFIEGVVNSSNHSIDLETGIKLPLPAAKHPAKKVLLGIRPEHLQICPKEEAFLSGKIHFIEDLGADKLIQVKLGERQPIVVRLFESTVNHTDHIYLKFDLNKANLFCSETGTRLGGWNEKN
ncbi:sn-glycerol 3-phosphate transport system ATP-binding protein (plasmid) [Legionella adelaidensis]|uniref:sn-glycerol 3-phosphate transport system ATP-binding protein n=1 Tax=Legionella adelaidensis TaxID=45056 RepID=A0A0W0R4L6_9GAMM|nr:sn-glycerol-3-phosphate ABC transporter ATP-binding protein UgpC [Legionella adelaidensis]KTC65989.1 sn-glycerol-3-phosphate transport, ATP binding protein [Legionella adelaidensis]VEH86313.1 sn-glycerol 3-phosphate transport system ATP-binding protein [Legionella adelaidensis]